MCYTVMLSTDSPVDLSQHHDRLIAFSRDLPGRVTSNDLMYPHRWFVGSAHGCSCGFRHLYVNSIGLGFGEFVDWFSEEPDDIEATRKFIGAIRSVVEDGARVDCIDAWDDAWEDDESLRRLRSTSREPR